MNTLKWISAPQKLITLLVVSLLLSVSPAIACTNVQLNAADGSCVVSRTMDDNPAIMKIKVALTPRGKAIPPTNPDGSPGLSYTMNYSSFGLPVTGSSTPTNAMNEKGLTLSVQILNASYYPTSVHPEKKSIMRR